MNKFANELAKVMENEKKGIPKYFDLSECRCRELVSKYFGGEKVMQEQYPVLYKSYCNAVEQGLGEVSYEGFCDGAVIYCSRYNQDTGTIKAAGRINFTGRVKHVFASIYVMQGETVIKQYNVAHSNRSIVDIQCETNEIANTTDAEYVVNLFVVWEDSESNKLQCMATGTQEINLTDVVTYADAVDKMTLYHPTKVINGVHRSYRNEGNVDLSEPIIVAYNRAASGVVDYQYNEKRVGKLEEIYLDVEYSVLLKEGYTYVGVSGYTAVLLCDQEGTLFYEGGAPEISSTDKDGKQELRVKWDTDWVNTIPNSVQAGNRIYRIWVELNMILKAENSNGTSSNIKNTVIVSNLQKNNDAGNNEISVADLHLYWGCLAEGTKILMADGSEKEIQNLQSGEKVLNSKGEAVEINRVITGDEEYIYRTYTESGKLVSASLLHPFAAEQGDLLLRDFDYKTRLKVKNEDEYVYETVINCYPEKYEGKVYSLELEDTGKEKTIIADGFVTYDNSEVKRIAEENYVPEDVVLSDEEQQEFDKLKDMLKQRNAKH